MVTESVVIFNAIISPSEPNLTLLHHKSPMPAQERPRTVSSDLSTSSPNFFRAPLQQDFGPFTPTDNLLSSLDSDDQVLFAPAAVLVPYEPIPIPREPNLEEMLQEASESTELDQVRHLKLCVISENVSLQRVASYCPLLTSLNLEGSALNTLRELGCMLSNLRYLDVSRCGLRNFDGTSGLGSVTHLVANCNQIEYLDPCSFLDELEELSVQGNLVRTTYNLRCLAMCLKLRTLHMNGNPIEEEHESMQELGRQMIPSLIFMNGLRIREEPSGAGGCNDDSLSSQPGTSSSGSFSSMEKSFDALNFGTTAQQVFYNADVGGHSTQVPLPQNSIDNGNARVSSTSFGGHSGPHILSRDRPLSADLLRLRQKSRSIKENPLIEQQKEEKKQLGMFPSLIDKEYPRRLPQTPVELELGVIGAAGPRERCRSAFSSSTTTDTDTTISLFRLAEQWRKTFRQQKTTNESAKGRALMM